MSNGWFDQTATDAAPARGSYDLPDFNVLHLTDVHFGQASMHGRWPTVKAQLLQDLSYVTAQAGPIDLIALTGDIANRGAQSEFHAASEFLEELGLSLLSSGGELPFLAVVPGNHDLVRPARRSLQQRALEELWDSTTEAAFFDDPDDEVRAFVDEVFLNYRTWFSTQPLPVVAYDHTGPLVGDYSMSLQVRDLRVGVLGLNSTFRHVSDRAREGSLTVATAQIQQACGGDLPNWSRDLDLGFVLTHHPTAWLHNADEVRDALFNDAGNVRMHLCGHLHLERYSAAGLGTSGAYYTHQGQSLFGLESFGEAATEERQHGYAVLSFDRTESGLAMKVWPRGAYRTAAGTWRVDRKAEFGLPRGSDSSEAIRLPSFSTGSPSSPEPLTTAVAAPPPTAHFAEMSLQHTTELLALLRGGELVAVAGDRFVTIYDVACLAFTAFREGVWEALDTGVGDDGTASTEQLLTLVEKRDANRARSTVAHFLGNPGDGTIAEARRLLMAPWSGFLYLSPLADVERALAGDDPSLSRYEDIDGTKTAFHLPKVGQPFVLRLTETAVAAGSARLTLNTQAADERTTLGTWTRFARQLLARAPVVFLADSVTALPIWRLITDRDTARKSYQPPAYLVCPALPVHLQAALPLYGVKWIQSSVAAFTDTYLATSRAEVAEGLQRQGSRLRRPQTASLSVELRRRGAREGSRDYLLGNSPTWGDVLEGYAADLTLKTALLKAFAEAGPEATIVATGTAGSGRTTSLMQCALALQTGRQRVAWIDSTVYQSIPDLIEEIQNESYDVIVIDDVDVFGAEASRLVRDIRRSGVGTVRRVIAGVRSVRAYVLEDLADLRTVSASDLSAGDVTALIAVLRTHKAVANKQLSDGDIRELLSGTSRGQLLVGMIQATSGLPFGKKIASECDQLTLGERLMYGCFAVVTSEREAMTEAEALEAVGGDPREAWRSFNRLLQTKLIRQQPGSRRFEVRHRVVAEEVRTYLLEKGLLAEVVRGTLRAYAAAARHLRGTSYPERRTLVRLLNHSYLISLRLDADQIRDIYNEVEDLLHDDFHYWLQRGSFEVERGDNTFALHDLTSAMTTPGGENDPKVLTEFSYLRLKLALRLQSVEGTKLGLDAFGDISKVILANGENSPHTFVVLARDGLAWLESAPIGDSQREELATAAVHLLGLAERLEKTNGAVAHHRSAALARFRVLAEDRPA